MPPATLRTVAILGVLVLAPVAGSSGQVRSSTEDRLAVIRALETKSETRPVFQEDDESDREIAKWHDELRALLRQVSSFRDPRAASALAKYIDESEAHDGLVLLGVSALSSVIRMVSVPDPDKRLAAIGVLAGMPAGTKANAERQQEVRRSLNLALSDKERSVREAANNTLSAYGGRAVPMPKPLFEGMSAQPCVQDGYLAFEWVARIFVLTYGGPNGVGVPRRLPMNDHAKSGIRCDPDRIRVLVNEPFPSPTFSIVSFSISDPAATGSIEVTSLPSNRPVPAFETGRFEQGRRVYPLPGRGPDSSFELVTETSTESVDLRGTFHYLRVTLVEKDSRGRAVKETLLVDSSYLEAAN